MTFNLQEIALVAITNAISGLIENIFYIILFIWGIKTLVRQVPKWLDKYEAIKFKEMQARWAKGVRQ